MKIAYKNRNYKAVTIECTNGDITAVVKIGRGQIILYKTNLNRWVTYREYNDIKKNLTLDL